MINLYAAKSQAVIFVVGFKMERITELESVMPEWKSGVLPITPYPHILVVIRQLHMVSNPLPNNYTLTYKAKITICDQIRQLFLRNDRILSFLGMPRNFCLWCNRGLRVLLDFCYCLFYFRSNRSSFSFVDYGLINLAVGIMG